MTAAAGAHPEVGGSSCGSRTRPASGRRAEPRTSGTSAVGPERDAGAAVVPPKVPTRAVALMLAETSRVLPPGTHAVVALDRAGWHTPDDLEVPPNLTLVPLPACSPGLNPVEKAWQHLRDRDLSHRPFRDPGAVVDAYCAARNRPLAEPGRLRSLTAFPWLPPCVSSSWGRC